MQIIMSGKCTKTIKGKKVNGIINPSSGRCVKKDGKIGRSVVKKIQSVGPTDITSLPTDVLLEYFRDVDRGGESEFETLQNIVKVYPEMYKRLDLLERIGTGFEGDVQVNGGVQVSSGMIYDRLYYSVHVFKKKWYITIRAVHDDEPQATLLFDGSIQDFIKLTKDMKKRKGIPDDVEGVEDDLLIYYYEDDVDIDENAKAAANQQLSEAFVLIYNEVKKWNTSNNNPIGL